MATYGDCRKYAAYCLEMAEAAGSEESRVKYLELAQAWLSDSYFPVTPKPDSS